MKRILTLIVCMMSISMTLFAASFAKCLLQHKGGVKIYNSDAIETAIKNAVEGDTIFLTDGKFPGFTVNKKITVRGAGQGTKITGDINVSISGNPTLTQTVLEGFDATDRNVTLTTAMNGLKIKQCKFKYLTVNANINDAIIDRCYISDELSQVSSIKGMTVINSYVQLGYRYSSTDSPINYVNCYVYPYYIDRIAGTFINSIIGSGSWDSLKTANNCNFISCLIRFSNSYTVGSSCTEQNCYHDSASSSGSEKVDDLESLGYLGNDGTVVGRYGGLTPYTLDLAVPKVTENTITLDPTTRILNVSLKVTAN